MSAWGQLNFQDAASPIMAQLIYFHDHAMLVITLIIALVGYAIISLITNKFICNNIFEAQEIETVWTILPAITLLFLALPSLRLLYLMDEVTDPTFTLKTIGHQWYWSYEYSDFTDIEFDSYMLPTNDLEEGQFRLLEVDNRAVLPMQTEIRLLVTAADVIHSWTIPALGIKADAVPGRLNQLGIYLNRPGIFYGQCSEICGANHSFMPIALEAVDFSSFTSWVAQFD
uniref:Cytochrome c oxidase subunit 2 n=1 Tax=Iphione sp. YZ-2018 TaxID=2153332 RepID=A0A343W6G9_9ANNE|nr:cytochrome c oxidase subunit 2 [Iphione sp. YZ-2018]